MRYFSSNKYKSRVREKLITHKNESKVFLDAIKARFVYEESSFALKSLLAFVFQEINECDNTYAMYSTYQYNLAYEEYQNEKSELKKKHKQILSEHISLHNRYKNARSLLNEQENELFESILKENETVYLRTKELLPELSKELINIINFFIEHKRTFKQPLSEIIDNVYFDTFESFFYNSTTRRILNEHGYFEKVVYKKEYGMPKTLNAKKEILSKMPLVELLEILSFIQKTIGTVDNKKVANVIANIKCKKSKHQYSKMFNINKKIEKIFNQYEIIKKINNKAEFIVIS